MDIETTEIEGVLIIKPKVFGDQRGYFFESFNQKEFNRLTQTKFTFVQDNQSKSKKGALRGLHFQKPPYEQGKLVRVFQGRVLDVVVDIRKHSPTFGRYFTYELTAESNDMLWIPPGMAHGFVSLEDETVFFYKCTNYYEPASEGTILWSDSGLNIDWKVSNPVVSEKDKKGELFNEFESPF